MISAVDSNILAYTVEPGTSPRKMRARDIVIRIMRAGTGVFLLQTLAEFSNVVVRKLGMPAENARKRVEAWRATLPVRAAVEDDLAEALDAVRDHRLQFWDAMLWATAKRVGVRALWTEDMQDGQVLGGVQFINPFNPANDAAVDRILPP